MRLKKQKRHRKAVRFYSACFGFREPYKVFCDGTFINHLILHGLTPADDSLSHLLGGRVILFTSRCVIGELTSLGKSYTEALEAANLLMIAICDHEKRVKVDTCIHSLMGESNQEHFFLATQDFDIRKKFREVPGVPIIYGLRNSLFLEEPSLNQREFIKSAEEKRLHMNESEYKKIWKRGLREKLTSAEEGSPVEEEFAKRNKNLSTRAVGVVDKIGFKKKRAKGPNPLSCKKKKQNVGTSAIENQGPNPLSCKKKKQNVGTSAIENQNGISRTVHKRKRSRKRKKEQETKS